MNRFMIAVVAIVASVTVANAGVTCYQVGRYTYCTDSATGTTQTCYQVGRFTYCN